MPLPNSLAQKKFPCHARAVILAGDIGGTKVNLAYYEVEKRGLNSRVMETYSSHDYPDLASMARAFLAAHHLNADYACFGIAGPVIDNKVKTPNLPWMVDGVELSRVLKLNSVFLLNDLEAAGYGISTLEDDEFHALNEGAELHAWRRSQSRTEYNTERTWGHK